MIKFKKKVILFLLGVTVILNLVIIRYDEKVFFPKEKILYFKVNPDIVSHIESYCIKNGQDFIKCLTKYEIMKEFELNSYNSNEINEYLKSWQKYKTKDYSEDILLKINGQIYDEVSCFPVIDAKNEVNYVDSYGNARTYGGKRVHLGTDIMDNENDRGRLKIVSMTDGVIENIGWNEKGGWRVGIKSRQGAYYYYAHLDSYNDLIYKGMEIKAGQLLGRMGDTGYGVTPGTRGKFPVHLHIGIMLDIDTEEEIWINPFYILKYIENKK